MNQVADTSRFQTGRVLTISLGHAMHDTYTAFLAPLLPVLIASLSLSKTEAGLLAVCLQVPSLLQPLIGHMADRFSLRYFVILAPAVTATAMSLLGVAPAYLALVLLLLVAGTSSACMHAVGPVMAGRVSGPNLGRGMSFWMVGGELGRTVGPVVIVSAIGLLTFEGTPWLVLGGLLASVGLYVRLRDIPGRPTQAEEARPWRQALGRMRPLLVPLAGFVTTRVFLLVAVTTYLPTFLSGEGSSLWHAGAALSVVEGAGVIGALLGGSVSDRLGRRSVLFASMSAAPVLMLLFLTADGWVRFPLLVLIGVTALSVTPVIMAVVQESFPENRALANGIYMAIGFGIRAVATVLLGAAGDWWGLRPAFYASGILCLLGLPLILRLPMKPRSSRLDTVSARS